jgi:hypothetical protein
MSWSRELQTLRINPWQKRYGGMVRQGWVITCTMAAEFFFFFFFFLLSYSLSDLIGNGAAAMPRRHTSANHDATLDFVRGEVAVSVWCK